MIDDAPWNREVRGEQVLPLINEDCATMRVPAGPGTGKTFGLRRRVLRLLHPDGLNASSDQVLVCTFNRVIANDLRREIEDELKPYGLRTPVIRTVHGLAASLADRPTRFLLPQEIEAMIYDVRETNPELDEHYERKQSKAMRALREHEAGLVDHSALGTAVRHWLTDHGAALVGDLPRAVEARLRGGDFGEHRYDHIIIDEFQDLTEIETRLVLGLRAQGGQVVALGDKKQSIYAFRGNEGHGLEVLPNFVSGALVDHEMDECQRCPSEIVQLANDVMAIYNEPLVDVQGAGGHIDQLHHTTPEAEHTRMAQEIVRVFKARPHDKHLVLVTRRKWGYDVRNAIRELDPAISAQTVFSEDILETWPAREAFVFLSLVAEPDDAATLRDWISYREPDAEGKKWKAPKRNAPAYAAIRAERGVLDLEKTRQIAQLTEGQLSGYGRRNVLARVQRLQRLLGDLPETEDPGVLIAHILDPERWVTAQSAAPDLARDDIDRLRAEAERMLDDEPAEVSLKLLVEHLRFRISTREPLGLAEDPAIKIVTLWGAKGLTADYVYIVGLCDEALPGPYDEDSTGLTRAEYEREQLRLLFVSLTRARRALVISRPLKIRRGRVAALGLTARTAGSAYWQELRQCRFFGDVPASHLPASVAGMSWDGIAVDV